MILTLPFLEAVKAHELPNAGRSLFSSEKWVRTIVRTYGTKIMAKMVIEDGAVRSWIVYSVVKNFLECKICQLSYSDYCDGHVENLEDWKSLFASLREDHPRYRIALRNLRDPLPRAMDALQVLSVEKFHSLSLGPSLRDLWKGTHDSFRSAVKQSEKAGVIVRRCEKGELKKFYDMHLGVRKEKYKVFPQPYRFFDILWEEMIGRGDGVLLGAYSPQGEMIGGNVYLMAGTTFYYKFNTSSLRQLNYRANNLLFWEGIKYAKALGCAELDLGSSGLHQQGLILFKEHTGAVPSEITHLGYAPEGYRFSQKRILKWMTQAFTLPFVPKPLVRWGSSVIYPYLA